MTFDPKNNFSSSDSDDFEMDRLSELLADRALGELSVEDSAELERLLSLDPAADAETFDRLASVVQMQSLENQSESMPDSLRLKLQADAARVIADGSSSAPLRIAKSTINPVEVRPYSNRSWLWKFGPSLAAAAILLIGFSLMNRPKGIPSAGERRLALLKSAGDVKVIEWTTSTDPAAKGATGDVAWSNANQTGYMRFKGLATNDPKQSQYQLWIFDPAQDAKYPVDGGVFDISDAGEVIVPIKPKIHVSAVTLFAVTIEKPGGVVVSDRKRIPLLANVK